MDYRFETLDLTADSEEARSRRSGWLHAVFTGFHEGRADDGLARLWHRDALADDATCVGAWLPPEAFGAGDVPVATTAWFDKTLNAGRELVPARLITDVTTSPAHRRRGLVRRLLEDCLADAVDHGLPLATLTVSEATIYGRWGFGAATFGQAVELDTGPRFGLRGFTDPGRVELLDPTAAWPHVREQLDHLHRASRGSVGTPAFYETILTGAWNMREGGPDKQLRTAVHLSPGGGVDGVVVYRSEGKGDDGARTLKVYVLRGDDATATLALWQFVAGIDLVGKVVYEDLEPHDPLRWALTDMNALKLTTNSEFLWVRVLDVPAAFAARPWVADDSLVIEVDDAQGYAAGHWRVTTKDGAAEAVAVDDEPDLRLDAETLGSLYLGGVPVRTLHGAGRMSGTAAEAERLAAMADLADPPYNLLGF